MYKLESRFRVGRAVDAVTGFVQANPRHADGVVGSGRQDELRLYLPRLGGFGEDVRVKGVVRIRGDLDDVQLADGSLLDVLRDAAREMRQQVCVRVKRLQDLARQADRRSE